MHNPAIYELAVRGGRPGSTPQDLGFAPLGIKRLQ